MRILYIDIDCLRPDHLGCYGYHRNTSPNIDRFAAQGMRCTNFYASDAPCLPSRAAWMTGRFGRCSSATWWSNGPASPPAISNRSAVARSTALAWPAGAEALPELLERAKAHFERTLAGLELD